MKWCGLGMWACTWECTPVRAVPVYHYIFLSSCGPRSKSIYRNGDRHPTHTLWTRFQNLMQNPIYLIVLTELQKNYKLYYSIVIHIFSVCACWSCQEVWCILATLSPRSRTYSVTGRAEWPHSQHHQTYWCRCSGFSGLEIMWECDKERNP